MTELEIKEQIIAIREVTKSLSASKEKAAAFLRSAGIPKVPATPHADKIYFSKISKWFFKLSYVHLFTVTAFHSCDRVGYFLPRPIRKFNPRL